MSEIKRAIYPGTFDPITNGHVDIITRASSMFDEIIVAVADNPKKNPMFTVEQRIEMAKKPVQALENVKVIGFSSLLVDLSDKLNANIVIRGIRAVSDFEYEFQMGYANASLKKELETIFLMPSLEYAFISSSIVRSLLPFNGKIEHLVPHCILENIQSNLTKKVL
ncbi:MAG: pantetheine-phosphate adenylyltransferase [Sulfurovum sp.]|nr:MAG: pantetheine-phosphate adenylyltransferase [Sulfurovum sp.]